MAVILAVTNGPAGMRWSTIELGRRLVAAGHAVTFAGDPSAHDLAEHHGLGFCPLGSNGVDAFLAEDTTGSLIDRLRRLPERRCEARRSTGIDAFVSVLGSLRPDLVLIDGEMHEHIVATAGAGFSLALLNTFASIWRRPGLPPPHTSIQPGVGWRGSRIGITLAWMAFRLRKRARFLRLRAQRVGCDRISLLRGLASDMGLDLDRETDASQWLIPFTYPRFPVLSLHALEFELPHEPPPGVHYVGPMVLEDRLDRPMAEADRRLLDGVLDRHVPSNPDRVLIFAGFGSFFTAHRRWLRRLVAAIRERPGWELVLALGDRSEPADLGELPAGVHAFARAPQLEILARADAAIVHGGINTIDECVLAGVPMLTSCGGETDMAGNTVRVVHHGIGLAADPERDTTGRILDRLDRLLGDLSIAGNLSRMGALYRAYSEEEVAQRAVDRLLFGGRGPSP